jgi:hypothetical protein
MITWVGILGIEVKPHILVCWYQLDSWMVGLLAVMAVVLSSEIAAQFFVSTLVYPASTNLGTLTSAKCSPGKIFISCARLIKDYALEAFSLLIFWCIHLGT